MRKLMVLGLTVVFSSFFIQSCDPWEDETYHPTDPIGGGNEDNAEVVGTWKMTSYELDEPIDINGDGEAHPDLLIETGCFKNNFMILNEDFTGMVIYSETIYFITADDGSIVSYDCLELQDETPFIWTIEDNLITTTFSDSDLQFTLQVDGQKLTTNDYTIPDLDMGELTWHGTITYTKQED